MTTLPTDAIQAAALWLAAHKEPPPLAVPAIRDRFGLSMLEACRACRLAAELRRTRP